MWTRAVSVGLETGGSRSPGLRVWRGSPHKKVNALGWPVLGSVDALGCAVLGSVDALGCAVFGSVDALVWPELGSMEALG